MLALLRTNAALRRLWIASTISLVGDWLSFVAISLLTLEKSGSALDLALIYGAHWLPNALLSPLGGVVADRFDRRTVLVASALLEAALTFAMVAAASQGAVLAVQLLVLARSAASAFVAPAESGAFPLLVPQDRLVDAGTLFGITWSLTYVGGMAMGGALALLGPATALALDALSFVLAALVLATLPPLPPGGAARRATASELARAVLSVPRDLGVVGRLVVARPDLARFVLAKSPVAMAAGAGWLAVNLLATRVHPLGAASISLGILQAVRGVGTGLGPMLARRIIAAGAKSTRVLAVASVVAILAVLAFGFAEGAAVALALVFVWGCGSGANWVLAAAELQRRADERFVGRLSALDGIATTIGMSAGALFAAILDEHPTIRDAAWVGLTVASLAGVGLLERLGAAVVERDVADAG